MGEGDVREEMEGEEEERRRSTGCRSRKVTEEKCSSKPLDRTDRTEARQYAPRNAR